MDEWKRYKLSVPTYGAILVSADLNHVLLVQSFWAKSSWGFPKGKVNENEDPVRCAVREVFEETGFDTSHLISPTDFFESIFNYQFTRLYVVAGVPMDAKFVPRTRNEIKSCEWFPIDLLPTSKTDTDCKVNLGMNANSFFMVLPFVKKLKKWVFNRREQRKHNKLSKSESKALNNKRQRHKSMGDIDNLWQGAVATPNDSSSTFYPTNSHAPSNSNKAMTVAKCSVGGGGGETPANIKSSTPIEGATGGKRRDKASKPNIKRQLFGPDVATAPDHCPTSPAPISSSFSFTNFPVKPQKYSGTKPKTSSVLQFPLSEQEETVEPKRVIEPMHVKRFKEWDNFSFDMKRISNCFADLMV